MPQASLTRQLTVSGATALVVGQVIAVGIFLTPGSMILTLGSPLLVLLVWLGMGVMAVCGALCYGALAARYPHAGGGYVYLREAFGPRVAFVYGWKCLLVMDPGITAALATGLAGYVGYLLPLHDTALRAVAIAAIAGFAVLHIVGVRVGTRLLTAMSVLKVGLVVVLIVLAMGSPVGSWQHFTPFAARHVSSPSMVFAVAGAFVAAFFSFGGWWEVTRMTGEVRDPGRTMPRALLGGLAIVTLVYTAASLSFIYVIPVTEVAAGQAFVAQVGSVLLGPRGGDVVAGVVIVCVLGSLGAMQMLAPRLYVAMAQDGVFPAAAGAVHPRLGTPARAIALQGLGTPARAIALQGLGTPARAIALQGLLACILVGLGTFDTIVAYFVFATVAFIGLTVSGVFVLRRRGPALHVPGYPFTPVLFLAMVGVLMVLLLLNTPAQALLGAIIVLLALPVYALVSHPGPIAGARESST